MLQCFSALLITENIVLVPAFFLQRKISSFLRYRTYNVCSFQTDIAGIRSATGIRKQTEIIKWLIEELP